MRVLLLFLLLVSISTATAETLAPIEFTPPVPVASVTSNTPSTSTTSIIRTTADISYLIASPLIYKNRRDLLTHYLFTNLAIKAAMKLAWCKRHPYVCKIGVFGAVSIGKELIYDKGLGRGNADWSDVYAGNLPGLLVNL